MRQHKATKLLVISHLWLPLHHTNQKTKQKWGRDQLFMLFWEMVGACVCLDTEKTKTRVGNMLWFTTNFRTDYHKYMPSYNLSSCCFEVWKPWKSISAPQRLHQLSPTLIPQSIHFYPYYSLRQIIEDRITNKTLTWKSKSEKETCHLEAFNGGQRLEIDQIEWKTSSSLGGTLFFELQFTFHCWSVGFPFHSMSILILLVLNHLACADATSW